MIRDALSRVDEAVKVAEKRFLTSVGLSPDVRDNLTDYDIEMLAVYAETLGDVQAWILADLLVSIENKVLGRIGKKGKAFYAERDRLWNQLVRNACKRDYHFHTLYNYRATALAFPFERRRHTDSISFEHHRVLVSFSKEEQEYWLDAVEANHWSVQYLRGRVYSGDGIEPPIYYDPVVRKGDCHVEVRVKGEVLQLWSESPIHIERKPID